jgi:hypothetical protein
MPPAVIAAGIGAAGAIGGAVLSGNAQKHAAQQATNATTQANNQAVQAQLQLGGQSLDLQRQMYNNNTGLATDIYNQNFNILSPYAANGLVASNAVNAMLGLPASTPMQSQVHAPTPIAAPATGAVGAGAVPGGGSYTGPSLGQIAAMKSDGIPGNYQQNLAAYLAAHPGA